MKTVKRFSALLLAILLIASLSSVAFASDNYDAINGGTYDFYTVLRLNGTDSVPNVKFAYTIECGPALTAQEAIAAYSDLSDVAKTDKIDAGVGTPAISNLNPKAEFTTGMAKISNAYKDTVTLDFTNCSFTEPGVYHYIVRANQTPEPALSGITLDPIPVRHVYLTIKENGSGVLEPGGIVYKTVKPGDEDNRTLDSRANSDALYTNQYGTQVLSLTKRVDGNQGSWDKFFKFEIHVANAGAGTVLTVDDSSTLRKPGPGDETPNGATTYSKAVITAANGTTSYTCDSNGATKITCYLTHNDEIVITGMPGEATYYVTEAEANSEGYTTSWTNNGTAASPVEMGTSTKAVICTNKRDGIIPTGVMLSVVPGVLIVTAAAAGLILLGRKKKTEA